MEPDLGAGSFSLLGHLSDRRISQMVYDNAVFHTPNWG